MFTVHNIPEGTYEANPIMVGITRTKNEHIQLAFECGLKVFLGDGSDKFDVVRLTKFGGIESDEGLMYAAQDAENCGCDTNLPIEQWKVNPKLTVICKVVRDEYGTKLKSIFKNEPLEAGYLIRKNALDEGMAQEVVSDLNARMAALRAAKNDAKPVTSQEKIDGEAASKVAKKKGTPI